MCRRESYRRAGVSTEDRTRRGHQGRGGAVSRAEEKGRVLMIPLMKSAFLREQETKRALAEFIIYAPRLSMDSKCREFEQEFAALQGRKHAVLFNSGGSANLALLQALKKLGRL